MRCIKKSDTVKLVPKKGDYPNCFILLLKAFHFTRNRTNILIRINVTVILNCPEINTIWELINICFKSKILMK